MDKHRLVAVSVPAGGINGSTVNVQKFFKIIWQQTFRERGRYETAGNLCVYDYVHSYLVAGGE
jgi:hypothetical protein